MILTAHQPSYFPWLGFFAKVAKCDLFCAFDAVQMTRRDWVTRNYIKTQNGPLMLSVPVQSNGRTEKRLCDVEIVQGNWVRKHMRSIECAYSKAPYFQQHYAGIGAILDLYAEGGLLVDLNLDLLRYFLRALGIQKQIVRASDYNFDGFKEHLVLDMCVQLGATEYIFGGEGENYTDGKLFDVCGIKTHFQKYQHPVYQQLHGEFVPNMSVVDLLMNEGPKSCVICSI